MAAALPPAEVSGMQEPTEVAAATVQHQAPLAAVYRQSPFGGLLDFPEGLRRQLTVEAVVVGC